jgi:hypothetical protein
MVMNWARGVPSGLTQWVQGIYGVRPAVPAPTRGASMTASHMDLYRILRAYYYSNGLYDVLRDVMRRQGVAAEALKPLRNPTYRVVEFHAGHLWPGALPAALPIMADNQRIIEPIEQIWQWSNWGSRKQVASRHQALYGDMFLKVAQTDDGSRVYLQTVEPEHVTDFDADERDFLTYVRIDVPMLRRNADGTTSAYQHVEVWDKSTGLFRVWEHTDRPETATEELGVPLREDTIESFGIDFIPIVHAKFADIGDDRGLAAVVPALDKIDEGNRQATRLAQMIFRHNNVTNALERTGVDAQGRPLPPVRVNDTDGLAETAQDTITLGDDTFVTLPGNTTLKQLVPNINYEAALHVLQDHMIELEGDLPELVLYRMSDGRDLSGRAVRLMMQPAIKRVEEARGNAESALVRAQQMGLSMGQNANLWDVGSYDAGDFDHCFEQRDVMATDELERAQAQQADGYALKAYVEAGMPLEIAVQEIWGWSPERAAQFTVERLAALQREQTLATEDVVDPGVTQ